MNRSLAAAVALLVPAAMGLVACGRDDSPREPASPDATPWSVTLVDAGAEPRAPLRHRFVNGTRSYDLVQSTTTGEGDEKRTQTTRAVLDVAVEDAGPADARLVVTVHGLATDATPAGAGPVGPGGLTLVVTSRADGRGRIVGTHPALSGDASAAGRDAREQALASVVAEETRQALPPLPEAPIGIGARWTVEGTTSILGLSIPTQTEITLEALDGAAATVRILTRAALRDRALPAEGGKTMRVATLDLSMSGRQRFGGDVVFGEGEVRSKTRMAGTVVGADGEPQRFATASEATLSIRARR